MFTILAGLSTGLFTLISSIIGRLLAMAEAKANAAIAEREALMERAKLVVKDRERAQRLPEANFARRIMAISLVFTLIAIVVMSVLKEHSTMVIPTVYNQGFSFWSFLFGGGTGENIEFIQVPLTVVIVPFLDIVGVVVGFYFGSGGSLRGLR